MKMTKNKLYVTKGESKLTAQVTVAVVLLKIQLNQIETAEQLMKSGGIKAESRILLMEHK